MWEISQFCESKSHKTPKFCSCVQIKKNENNHNAVVSQVPISKAIAILAMHSNSFAKFKFYNTVKFE